MFSDENPCLKMRPTAELRGLLAALLFLTGLSALHAQTLEVTPSSVLCDETAAIRASGLQPNERVTIQADLVDGRGHRWASQAEFLADAQGTVDVSHQAPVKGSYDEVSAMGLIWSMKPEEKHVERYASPRELGTEIIEFRLVQNGKQVSSAQLEQRTVADGVHQIKIEGQLHGVLFVPGSNGRYPGVLVVGGSEGGLPIQKAAWLASHGFAAMALAYFRYEDLPPDLEAIPLEYFGRALGWMMQRPEILPDRIAVVGTSRGGELALQLGSMFPQITAVVAYVPASVRYAACCGNTRVPYAWTWHGQSLTYYSPRGMGVLNPTAALGAGIAVEHTHGPVLLISGGDDGVWPSAQMTDAIVGRLKGAHFSYPVEDLKYPHAGHLAGFPEIVPAWHGSVRHPVSGAMMDFGGTAKGDAQSSLDAIPKVLEFLRTNLEAKVQAQ
jgi:dienelactone hydrolase